MSTAIENFISDKNFSAAVQECRNTNFTALATLLEHVLQKKSPPAAAKHEDEQLIENSENVIDKNNPPLLEKTTRLMMLTNWTDSRTLCHIWNKMSKGNFTWNAIEMVWEEPADYYVVINCPPTGVTPPLDRTLVFHMEPNMPLHPDKWGAQWANPPVDTVKFAGVHSQHFNNNEWHLSKTWFQLHNETIDKNPELDGVLSAVLSDKYSDPGHIKRVDFTKFLESKGFPVHVYGGNKFQWKEYKGSLPYHAKDEALLPYKYTFNVENQFIRGYYTEKIIDGILAECLTVYFGCPNIRDYFENEAFVWLELSNFEEDYKTLKRMVEEDWHTARLPAIKRMKQRILDEYQFFPRVEKIILSF